jgi:hypothetical protein
MNCFGYEFFARSRFSSDQDSACGRGNRFDELEDLLDPFTVPDNTLNLIFFFELRLKIGILFPEPTFFQGLPQDMRDSSNWKGLAI